MSGWAVLWVVGLVGLLVALNLLVRRWASGSLGPGREVQVLARRRLDLHTTVWVVEVDGRRLLIGSDRAGPRLLAELDPPR